MPSQSSYPRLPAGCAEAFQINLQADKKLTLILNGLSLFQAACGYSCKRHRLRDDGVLRKTIAAE